MHAALQQRWPRAYRLPLAAAWSVVVVAGFAIAARSFVPGIQVGLASTARRIPVSGFSLYVGYSVATFVILGAAWWVTTGEPAARLGLFVWGRLIREAASDFLPFSQLGGIVFGVRAVAARGIGASLASASFIADLMAEMASQVLFTAFGVVLAATIVGDATTPTVPLLGGIAALAILTALLVSAPGTLALAERLARRVLPSAAAALDACVAQLRALYARRRRLIASFALNLLAWAASAIGAAVALRVMRFDVPLERTVALESLVFLTRSTAFAIPAGIGIQEAAYALIGPLLGLPVDVLLAVALIKRLRDAAIALPVLAIWQLGAWRRFALEGRSNPHES